MGKAEKLLESILTGQSDNNVSFDDLLTAVRSLQLNERTGKRHANIFQGKTEDGGPIYLNLQPTKNGKAKPYQIKQVRANVARLRGMISDKGTDP